MPVIACSSPLLGFSRKADVKHSKQQGVALLCAFMSISSDIWEVIFAHFVLKFNNIPQQGSSVIATTIFGAMG